MQIDAVEASHLCAADAWVGAADEIIIWKFQSCKEIPATTALLNETFPIMTDLVKMVGIL